MTDTPPDLGKALDELAEKMLKDACADGVTLDRKLDVFKIMSAHYVNVEKLRGKREPPDAGGQTMAGLRKKVAEGGDTPTSQEDDDEQTDPDQDP